MISWEAVTAIGTVFTGLVILATVLIGWRELDQVRRSNQLDGVMRIAERMAQERYQNALRFVLNDLSKRLEEPEFRAELDTPVRNDEKLHPEIIILLEHELIGTYVKNGLISGETIYDLCGGRLLNSWRALEPMVEMIRAKAGDRRAWSNTEWLSLSAARWLDRNP